MNSCSLWREPQVLSAYMAAASLILLLSRFLFSAVHNKNMKPTVEPARSSNSRTSEQNNRGVFAKHVDDHGGSTIFTFQAVRAVLAAALLVLTMARIAGVDGPKWVNLIQCITFVRPLCSTIRQKRELTHEKYRHTPRSSPFSSSSPPVPGLVPPLRTSRSSPSSPSRSTLFEIYGLW